MTRERLRRGKMKSETESLLIKAQNNAIRFNYIKGSNDNTQRMASVGYTLTQFETVNLIISKCCKLRQKEYTSIHDWVGKVIPANCAKNSNLAMLTKGICKNQTRIRLRKWNA